MVERAARAWRIDPIWWDDRFTNVSIPDEDLYRFDPEYDEASALPITIAPTGRLADLGFVECSQAFYCKTEHEAFWRSRQSLYLKWYELPRGTDQIRVFTPTIRVDAFNHGAAKLGGDLLGSYLRMVLHPARLPEADLFGGVGKNDEIFCLEGLHAELESMGWAMLLKFVEIPVTERGVTDGK